MRILKFTLGGVGKPLGGDAVIPHREVKTLKTHKYTILKLTTIMVHTHFGFLPLGEKTNFFLNSTIIVVSFDESNDLWGEARFGTVFALSTLNFAKTGRFLAYMTGPELRASNGVGF